MDKLHVSYIVNDLIMYNFLCRGIAYRNYVFYLLAVPCSLLAVRIEWGARGEYNVNDV